SSKAPPAGPCGPSSRPTATPACGRTTPCAPASSPSCRGPTSPTPSMPPPPSGASASRSRRPARPPPRPGPPARPPRARAVRPAALGRDHDPPVAVGAMDERVGPELARLAARRREQQDARAAPVVAVLAGGLAVDAHVLGPEQGVVVDLQHGSSVEDRLNRQEPPIGCAAEGGQANEDAIR